MNEVSKIYQPEVRNGVEVTHSKFGIGKVLARYGEDEKSRVIVKFKDEGEKKLSLGFAKLKASIPEPIEGQEEGAEA